MTLIQTSADSFYKLLLKSITQHFLVDEETDRKQHYLQHWGMCRLSVGSLVTKQHKNICISLEANTEFMVLKWTRLKQECSFFQAATDSVPGGSGSGDGARYDSRCSEPALIDSRSTSSTPWGCIYHVNETSKQQHTTLCAVSWLFHRVLHRLRGNNKIRWLTSALDWWIVEFKELYEIF